MKTKDLLLALALPGLFIACSDDLNEIPGVSTNVKGNLVELAPDFALIQNDGAITRGEWQPVNGTPIHLWMPVEGAGGVYKADEIGLAWTGVTYKDDGTVDGVASALGAVSDRVFTNYKFTHFAWKVNGKEPEVEKICENEITYKKGTVDLLSNYIGEDRRLKSDNSLPTYSEESGDTDVKNGLFDTDNSTVYAGQYIAYAPYDETNTSNYIMATSPAEMTYTKLYKGDSDDEKEVLKDIKNNIFMVGSTVIDKGGQRTSEFTTKNLSGYVRVKLTADASATLRRVILYSKEGFLTKVGLSASAILDPSKKGTDLYLPAATAERETSSTIIANIKNSDTEKGGAMKKGDVRYLFIPVLPTEASKSVELILIDENENYVKKTVEVNVAANSLCKVEFGGINFKDEKKLATDENSFRRLTGNYKTDEDGKVNIEEGTADDAAKSLTTVSVLGKIRLTKIAAIRGNYVIEPYSGTDEDALVISNEGTGAYGEKTNLRFTIHNKSNENKVKNPVVKVKMIIEAAGCCKDFGGRVAVGNAEIAGNVLVEGQKDVATGEIIKEAFVTEKHGATKHGWLTFGVGGAAPKISGTIENYGELQFGRFERNGQAQVVTTLTGVINNNNMMEICLNDGGGNVNNDDAKLDVESSGELNNKGTFTIEGVLAMRGTGSNKEGTIIERVSSQVTGNLVNNFREGEYICDVDDPGARFKEAVEGKTKPTTVVRFVEHSKIYDFDTVKEEDKTSIKKYVIDENDIRITLRGTINLGEKDIVVEKGTLAFGTINKKTDNSKLTVKNLVVGKNGVAGTLNADVTVKEKLEVNGVMTVDNKKENKAPTTLIVGDKEAQKGELIINKLVSDKEEVLENMKFENNTSTTVYGTIVNKGKAKMVQATQTEGDMPAILEYSVENGSTGNGIWTDGVPSLMEK